MENDKNDPSSDKKKSSNIFFKFKRKREQTLLTSGTLLNFIFLLILIYSFILSITLMGNAFKLFGNDFAKVLIESTSHPIIGLIIGILSTSIVQSSSTTTCIVVGLVSADALSIINAIPIIMGANVGTSVTNILVSLGHISKNIEFKRAFGASIVHDLFNVIAVIVIFPIQYFTNFLGIFSHFFAETFQSFGGLKAVSPIKLVTKPVIIYIDKIVNYSGYIELIFSLILLFLTLRYLVKVLKALIIGKFEKFFDNLIFKNAFISFLFGLIITALIQSSSITTSIIVPLVGAGILTIEQIFPYTLGANIGTTITAMLASVTTGNLSAITVAFAHLNFNIVGVILIYPFKFIPISLAKLMAALSIKNKLFPILYVLFLFFIIPLLIIYFVR